MRAAYHMAFIVFSAGAVAIPTMAPEVTDPLVTASIGSSQAIPDVVRNVTADLSARLNANREGSPALFSSHGMSIGESLPETVEVYPIPKHETYRYALVDGQRVIIDAVSRKVVYVIQ